MWNFDYSIPSFIVLVFFVLFYYLKPVVLLQSNKCFRAILLLEIIGFFITNYSCYADSYSANFSRGYLIFLNDFYYFVFLATYSLIALFFAKVLQIKIKKDVPTIIIIILNVIITLLVLSSPWTDFVYNISPTGKFERVKYFKIIYVANFNFIILILYYVIRFHKKLNLNSIVSSCFVIATLSACSILDYLFFYYLITDMFFLLVIFILFITFENPDIYVDQKTGLYNFQSFAKLIQEYLFRNKKFSVITFVIKNYQEKKQIYGVKQMDLALASIGKFLRTRFRNKKIFYLQSGRFAIIDKSSADFDYITDEIVKRSEKTWRVNKSDVQLNIFVIKEEDDISFTSLEDVFAGFDIAYEEEKKSSNNMILINQQIYKEIVRKRKVSKALEKALLEDSLQVYFQPIIQANTRKVVGAEALVRIHDEELGIIPPLEFISLAETNGSIEQLDEQVLSKACAYLDKTNLLHKGLHWLNVNLSPIQCHNVNLQGIIDNIIDSNSIDHRFIHLEITEDSMVDYQILERQMDILRKDGYRFSLDDFGSGFSNLTRVRKFHFNNIKLDMSLVKDHFASPDNMLIRVIKTFKDKGMTITAEGVETKEMADELQLMGCDYFQGYYFAKPLPPQEFLTFFLKFNC